MGPGKSEGNLSVQRERSEEHVKTILDMSEQM